MSSLKSGVGSDGGAREWGGAMPGLVIDWAALELAFESHVPDQRAFLDRRTGVLRFEGDPELVGMDPALLVRIEPVPSREQYRMMERFIATVINASLKDALQDSIVGKGAFRRFKDALGRFPDERKRWFTFREALLHRHILDWIKAAHIELQEMPAWNLELPMTPAPETPSTAAEGEPTLGADDLGDVESLKTFLLAWARSHGEEYRFLFGPAAFARLADDLNHDFIIHRKRSSSS
jgi:hypothetical protein